MSVAIPPAYQSRRYPKFVGDSVTDYPALVGKPRPMIREGMYNERLFTHNGRTQNITEWARECGIPYQRLYHRLYRGWPIDLALTRRPNE